MATSTSPARSEELLDEIQGIVLTEGFANLRMGRLATRLRCSRTTLYKLAPSKEDLILLVLGRAGDALYRDAAAAASVPGFSAADKIAAHLAVVNEYQDRGSEQLWRDVAAWEPASDRVSAIRERAIGMLRRHVEAGMASGEFRPTSAILVAGIISSVAHASHDADVVARSGLSAGEVFDEVREFLVRGMSAEPPLPPVPPASRPS